MIKVTANKSKRTFTIRVKNKKFKTEKKPLYRFEIAYFYEQKHWKNFLKYGTYYQIK